MKNKLTIAIQKKGRLATESLNLFKQAGFNFEITERSLKVGVRNFDLEILLLRSSDIPEIVANGIAEVGITGQNTAAEKGYPVNELTTLGFGKCELSFAYPENESDRSINGKRIATSYPQILRRYLQTENLKAQIVDLSGSVEIAPKLEIADLICDLVSTGSTLRSNGLTKGEVIFKSQAVIIANQSIPKEKIELLDKLLLRIESVLAAKKYKYIVMNAQRSNLEKIENCIHGLKKPTVSSLADSNLVSIAAVVEEDYFWSTIEKLKAAGASDILVLPIEKMIL